GLTSWDFGELPAFVTRRVGGVELRSYPALVDRRTCVDLVLLETAHAAAVATRAGVRRLLAIAARRTLAAIVPQLPAAFPHVDGTLPSRSESETFREHVLARILDQAFGLDDGSALPRTKNELEARLAQGTPRLPATFRLVTDVVAAAATELARTLKALTAASKLPSGRAAIQDIRGQLELLFPSDLMASVELARLSHYPRYLRAAQSRLERAVANPRKDADKLAPLTALLTDFMRKRATAQNRAAVRELEWAFEELRVAIFAPELKTALPVALPKLAAAVSALR
ncbi:MAG TPA: DUF3418 domain-containing protein, partial [Polyangiaceae bacterium]|nr:DUF3418 domain-containing protein [Polyangiaceae bacterium]